MDIRLKTEKFEYAGKIYELRCNMNVLADVQEHYNGDLRAAMGKNTMRSVLVFLAAMMCDYAEVMGWDPVTDRELGRALPFNRLAEVRDLVMPLVIDAVQVEKPASADEDDGDDADEDDDPNAKTTQRG